MYSCEALDDSCVKLLMTPVFLQVSLARRMGVPCIAIMLDTPVDVCLQRVGARRFSASADATTSLKFQS
jgi:predicted kinase